MLPAHKDGIEVMLRELATLAPGGKTFRVDGAGVLNMDVGTICPERGSCSLAVKNIGAPALQVVERMRALRRTLTAQSVSVGDLLPGDLGKYTGGDELVQSVQNLITHDLTPVESEYTRDYRSYVNMGVLCELNAYARSFRGPVLRALVVGGDRTSLERVRLARGAHNYGLHIDTWSFTSPGDFFGAYRSQYGIPGTDYHIKLNEPELGLGERIVHSYYHVVVSNQNIHRFGAKQEEFSKFSALVHQAMVQGGVFTGTYPDVHGITVSGSPAISTPHLTVSCVEPPSDEYCEGNVQWYLHDLPWVDPILSEDRLVRTFAAVGLETRTCAVRDVYQIRPDEIPVNRRDGHAYPELRAFRYFIACKPAGRPVLPPPAKVASAEPIKIGFCSGSVAAGFNLRADYDNYVRRGHLVSDADLIYLSHMPYCVAVKTDGVGGLLKIDNNLARLYVEGAIEEYTYKLNYVGPPLVLHVECVGPPTDAMLWLNDPIRVGWNPGGTFGQRWAALQGVWHQFKDLQFLGLKQWIPLTATTLVECLKTPTGEVVLQNMLAQPGTWSTPYGKFGSALYYKNPEHLTIDVLVDQGKLHSFQHLTVESGERFCPGVWEFYLHKEAIRRKRPDRVAGNTPGQIKLLQETTPLPVILSVLSTKQEGRVDGSLFTSIFKFAQGINDTCDILKAVDLKDALALVLTGYRPLICPEELHIRHPARTLARVYQYRTAFREELLKGTFDDEILAWLERQAEVTPDTELVTPMSIWITKFLGVVAAEYTPPHEATEDFVFLDESSMEEFEAQAFAHG